MKNFIKLYFSVVLLLVCASIAVQAQTTSTIFQDSFAGTPGTDLTAHTPTKISDDTATGGSWSVHPATSSGAIVIDGANRARNNFAVASFYLDSVTTASADVDMSLNINYLSAQTTGFAVIGALVNFDGTTSAGYTIRLDDFGSYKVWQLYKTAGGAQTLIGSSSASPIAGHVYTLRIQRRTSGSNATLFVTASDNGAAPQTLFGGTVTDTSPLTGTRSGIALFNDVIDATGGMRADNFRVNDPALAASTVPDAPSDLTGVPDSTTRAVLKWNNNFGTIVSSHVERKQGAGSFVEVGSVTGGSPYIIDTTVSVGTYIYRVRNRNATGDSAYSNEATVVVPPLSASLSVPSTAYVNESVVIDATASTGYASKKLASGVWPVSITYSDSADTDHITRPSHSFSTTGTKTITETIVSASGATSTATATISVINFPTASSTVTIADQGTVAANEAAVQAELNNATSWKKIVLTAGVNYGHITFPALGNSGYVRIVSSALASLPSNTRVSPTDAANMPKLATVTNAVQAISTALNAQHFTLEGVEVIASPGIYAYDLMSLGNAGATQNSVGVVAHHFIIDRCYIHNAGATSIQRGIGLNSGTTSIVNSYLSGFRQQGVETQAIGGWNGTGNYSIRNNYVQGGSENILFGGAATYIDGLLITSIEVRGNYIFKPRSWQGQGFATKNLFELKNGQQAVVDGNIMENCWTDGQAGFAILLTSRTEGGTQPWIAVSDVQITNNIVRHVGGGISAALRDDQYTDRAQGRNVIVFNNLFQDINSTDGQGKFLAIARSNDFSVDHNTVQNSGSLLLAVGYPQDPAMTGFEFKNNIANHGSYGIQADGTGSTEDAGFTTYFPDGVFTKNAVVGGNSGQYPTHAGNYFPANYDPAVGFVSYAAGNFALAAGSSLKNAATDGTDVGANFSVLNAATLHAIDGGASGFIPPTPPSTPAAPSGLTITVTANKATISFVDNSTNETSFLIEHRIGAGAFSTVGAVNANTTTFVYNGLAPLTSQDAFRVRAFNAAGFSAYSNTATANSSAAMTILTCP